MKIIEKPERFLKVSKKANLSKEADKLLCIYKDKVKGMYRVYQRGFPNFEHREDIMSLFRQIMTKLGEYD